MIIIFLLFKYCKEKLYLKMQMPLYFIKYDDKIIVYDYYV